LNRDNKHAPLDEDDDDLDGESHAADEPTAVWDEQALRAAGLTDLLKRRPSEPPPAPATPSEAPRDHPSIVVDQSVVDSPSPLDPSVATRPDGPRAPASAVRSSSASGGMGWGTTIALALALALVVYSLIRWVKG